MEQRTKRVMKPSTNAVSDVWVIDLMAWPPVAYAQKHLHERPAQPSFNKPETCITRSDELRPSFFPQYFYLIWG